MTIPNLDSLGIGKRKRYLIGVSGGRDSIALLHWMKYEIGCKDLIVCHLNHLLRGRESGLDSRFVRNLAKSYGFQFECEKKDVLALSKSKKISIEMAAREARMNFFGRAALKWRCSRVVLAHHADDNVETILMNLFRGSGNLSGIKEKSIISTDKKNISIYRPFIQIFGDQIDQYVKDHSLKFRKDSSNDNDEYLRNRTRNKVIPYLKKIYQKDIRKTILRSSNIAALESNFIDELLSGSEFSWTNERQLSVPKLKNTKTVLRSRIIFNWLKEHSVSNIGNAEVDLVLKLLNEKDPAKINLPKGKYVRRRNKLIFIE